MSTHAVLVIAPVASVCSALLGWKVARLMTNALVLTAGAVGSSMSLIVSLGGNFWLGGRGSFVVCTPIFMRWRWPLEVARVGM